MTKYIGFAGTYTRETSKGIYRFTLDTEAQAIQSVEVASEVGSPTYLTISEDRRHLYSVAQDGEFGGVAAYEIDSETGELRYLNRKMQAGAPPCFVDAQENVLLTANYHKGTVDLHDFNEKGGVQAVSSSDQHEGSGPHDRQEKPHVHYAAYTPDGKYVLAADLGTDELVTYQVTGGQLERVTTLNVEPGSGPRHVAFHPNGKTAYLLTELSSEVIVLDYNAENGHLTPKQTIKAIPDDFIETNDASAIYVSSDGKFLYTGNRGHNSITVFSIDDESKELTLIEHTPTGGEWPRDFTLDPSEKFIVASNQHSGNLVLFSRDETTGKLTQLDSKVTVPEAVCVTFLPAE